MTLTQGTTNAIRRVQLGVALTRVGTKEDATASSCSGPELTWLRVHPGEDERKEKTENRETGELAPQQLTPI